MNNENEASKLDPNFGIDAENEAAAAPEKEAKPKKERYISENETYGGKPTTIKGKISNFWYHHKWGTIVSTLAIVLVTVIVLQLINRTEYDLQVIYAGGQKISKIQKDGKSSQYENILSSLNRVGEDFDENGQVNMVLSDYYYLTDEEINNLEDTDAIDQSLIEGRDKLHQHIMTGEACLLFLSESLFDELYYELGRNFEDGKLFADLSGYLAKTDAEDYEYYGESTKAVKLHSLKFSELPGISDLPIDTVVCLRIQNNTGAFLNNEETFNNSVKIIKKIFEYGN